MPATSANTFDAQYIGTDISYLDVLAIQEQAVADVLAGSNEKLFFVEHAPVYTAGTSAIDSDYLGNNDIPVIPTGRGGKYTYHGTGQRVVYPIINLQQRTPDLRKYVSDLQDWLIDTLAIFGIKAFTSDEIGVWVNTPMGEQKIAAIGVRVRKWVTFHGIALNVNPDLNHFKGIIPCGLTNKGVASMQSLGCNATMAEVDKVLLDEFVKRFKI